LRLVATLLLWLFTTLALAVAIPTAWAQINIVDDDGYAAMAQNAAAEPSLQDAMASELATQVVSLAAEGGYDVSRSLTSGVAQAYTAGPDFPAQFAAANRLAHGAMFTDAVRQSEGPSDSWEIDLAPMLADTSFQQTLDETLQESLDNFNLTVPQTLTVPVTVDAPDGLRPGQLRPLATWGPWVSVGATVLAGMGALLTLLAARRRGKALASLGVSALLVGASGWAALEIGRRYIDDALNHTTGGMRQIADAMVGQAEASLHQWLNLTLAAGGVLVVVGVIVAMLGGLRRS
jgi:hypothetical protein